MSNEAFEKWAIDYGLDYEPSFTRDDVEASWQAAKAMCKQSEPFGYFKAEPFGWTDCAETDEGAIALYEAPTVQREGWVSDKDTLALYAARKIMLDVNTMMIPVDVSRLHQLQAKIQVVIADLLKLAPTDTE